MEDIGPIIEEFALVFTGAVSHPDRPIAFPNLLRRERLDFTLASLAHVDDYLGQVHARRDMLTDDEWHRTVMRAGAYLGEVIRRNARRTYVWVDYDDYAPTHPDFARLVPERTTATCAFLVEADNVTLPLNKIARFIEEGPENNTHYYASCDIAR